MTFSPPLPSIYSFGRWGHPTVGSSARLESRIAVQLRGHVCLDADIFLRGIFLPPDIDEGKDTGLLGQFAVRTNLPG